LESFNYGEEFFRLNSEAFEFYSKSTSVEEVLFYHNKYEELVQNKLILKEKKHDEPKISKSYLDESDYPPISNEDEVEDDEERVDEDQETFEVEESITKVALTNSDFQR
jgi:hypothetical protein